MTIPIKNLYHLICYAWGYLHEAEIVSIDATQIHDSRELLAHLLIAGTERVMRQGLDRGYVPRDEQVAGVRGQLDFNRTIATASTTRRKLCCTFDDLSRDVLTNRILRTTLRHLGESADLAPSLAKELLRLNRRLDGISEIWVEARHFQQVQLSRNNRFYGFLLGVCRLVHESLLPETTEGDRKFRDFTRDEAGMRRLFQAFVRNFLDRRLPSENRVSAPIIQWQGLSGAPQDVALVPALHTDVVVTAPGGAVIFDTKFALSALEYPYGTETLKSAHLFQLSAYLTNFALDRADSRLCGVLLYPTVARPLKVDISILGWPVRVVTLDLSRNWNEVEDELLGIFADSKSRLSPIATVA